MANFKSTKIYQLNNSENFFYFDTHTKKYKMNLFNSIIKSKLERIFWLYTLAVATAAAAATFPLIHNFIRKIMMLISFSLYAFALLLNIYCK
jgi:hypothetical protein